MAGCNILTASSVAGQDSSSKLTVNNDDKTTGTDSHCKSIKLNKEKPAAVYQRNLTEEEKTKLDKIQKAFVAVLDNKEKNSDLDLTDISGFMNFALLSVKSFVKFIKSVDEFRGMPMDMQTACVKAQMLKCLLLRCVYLYDESSEMIISHGHNFSEDTVKEGFFPHVDWAEVFFQYCRDSHDEFTEESVIQAVLQLVILFSPDGDDLVKRRYLSNIQDQYQILLKHYIESKFSFKRGTEICALLLQKIQQLKTLSSRLLEILHHIDQNKVQPLMLEVLNI